MTVQPATDPAPPVGIVGTLRAIADGVLAAIRDRVELASIELEQEKLQLIQALILGSAALLAAALALGFGGGVLVVLFWESGRLTVLTILASFYALAATALGFALRRFLSRQPPIFSATLAELDSDREKIRGPHPR